MHTTVRSLVSNDEFKKVSYWKKNDIEWLTYGDITLFMRGNSRTIIKRMINDLTGILNATANHYQLTENA